MSQKKVATTSFNKHEEEMELRRGPWTLEEDNLLINYIACHGEGRWNLLARCSGLKRTGKSCRLRWLNYLKPDIKRGNLSPEEQFLILELHSKWGNRWSRIAQHLPGRTDNEIKNYWRTRVQKQARQLKVDANSSMFRDAVRCYWMPRLLEKIGSSEPLHECTEPNFGNSVNIDHNIPNQDLTDLYNLSLMDASLLQFPYETSSSPSTSSHQPMNTSSFAIGQSQTDELNSMINDHYVTNDISFGLDSINLSQVSASNQFESYNSMVSSTSAHEIWSLDELWHVRKQNEWGGI